MNAIISYLSHPKVMRKTIQTLSDPVRLSIALDHYGFLKWIGDKVYLKLLSRMIFGKPFDLDSPQTFNEKLNWLKLNDRNPRYTLMADKYEVKKVIREMNLKGLKTAECYGVWERFDDIDFSNLPQQFVLKATHDSSGATICREKAKFETDEMRKRFARFLSLNNYRGGREWVYKDIPPRIIAEEFLDDGSGQELTDYKFWCFNGKPQFMYITNKGASIYENFYDMDFSPIPINHGFPRKMPEYDCPVEFNQMKEYASALSQGIPFVRVDFFVVNCEVYFGEFTFYDWGGLHPFVPEEWDYKLGECIQLPQTMK